MNKQLYPFFVGSLLIAWPQNAKASKNSQKPNILLVLMDDLGYADVGFMPGSSPDVYTPNIDVVAQQSTIFQSAYVTHPFSGPSRAGLMTGRSPHCLGSQFNLASFTDKGITTSEPFISDVLKDAGYYTGVIGKWHLGESPEYHPNNRGFDFFYGFLGGGHEYFTDTWISKSTFNPLTYSAGNYNGEYKSPLMLNKDYVDTTNGLYCTDVLTDAAVNFFDVASKDNKPFFLYLAYNAPHTPLQAQQKDITELKQKLGSKAAADGSDRLTYTAMMYNVDYNFKKLIDKLKATGEYNNTVIVFLSDNGGKTTSGANNSPLKGTKGDATEGGFRVPMFIHWPAGNVPQAYVNPYNYSSLDFYPTFANLAGATIPTNKTYDGINVWGNIINKTNPRKDSTLFAMRHQGGFNYTGVVQNNYKLYSTGNGTWLLYNLTTDIGETTNIASANPTVVASMKEAVYKWTWKHIRPLWFDAPTYGFEDMWISTSMPNFGKTFGSIYKSDDYKTTGVKSVNTNNENLPNIYVNQKSNKLEIVFNKILNSDVEVLIYDIQGRLLSKQIEKVQNENKYAFGIDSLLSNGVYIVQVKMGIESFSKQIALLR